MVHDGSNSSEPGVLEERARRAWIERQQTFKDKEEDFIRAKAAATTREERREAVDIMFEVFGHAAAPPTPSSRWIERWVEDRRPYHENALAPLIGMRAEVPLLVP